MTQNNYFYRLNLWLKERFPLLNFVSGFFLYFLAKAIITIDQQQGHRDVFDIFGMLMPAAHLFLLRVFDEYKDFKSDSIYYPNRVIQKGIFKLKEVGVLGVFAFIIELFSYLMLRKSLITDLFFLWLWVWTFLMYKEFFCSSWLKKKLFLYGFLHLLVTPFLLLTLLVLNIDDLSNIVDWKNIVLPLVISVLTGWHYEVSRKTKAPTEETGDLTYSSLWGINRALFVIYLSTVVTVFLSILFFNVLGIFNNYILLIGFAVVIISRLATRAFKLEPNPKARKKNEGVTLLVSLYAFLPPIIFAFSIIG